MKSFLGWVLLLVSVSGAQASVPTSVPTSELSWQVLSADASAVLEQTSTAPGTCQVSCRRPKQQSPQVWSAESCLAIKSELVFVDNACERVITIDPLPKIENDWRATPVVRVFKRSEQERVMSANQFVRDSNKLRMLTKVFRWAEGVAGTPGVPPRYREDALGVDLEAIDGMRHTIPFERGRISVDVLQAGEGQRFPLRYQWPKGLKQKLALDISMGMVVEVPGKSRESKDFPTVHYTLGVEHKGPDAKGNLGLKFKIADVALVPKPGAPPVDPALLRKLKALRKIPGEVSVKPRGAVRESRIESVEDESQFVDKSFENLKRRLDEVAPPFPEEPVGAGAKWRVTVLEPEGFELLQVVYTLSEFDGERGVLLTEVRLESKGQNLLLPNLPPGIAVWMNSMKLQGTGRTVFNLKQGIPESTTSASGEAVLAIQGRSRSQDIKVSPRVEIGVKPAEAAGPVAAPKP